MNILIVDDILSNRLLLRHTIEGEGHIVTEADDGVVAIELVKENKYDIVFMDMMMPIMNGYEATKYIKEILQPDLPVYVVSAYQKVDFPADWQSVNYDGVLSKPVSLNTIVSIINKHNNGTNTK